MKNSTTQTISFFIVLLGIGIFFGLIPLNIAANCPYSQDANGACILRACTAGDSTCLANNVYSQCLNSKNCPAITSTLTSCFGYRDPYAPGWGNNCITEPVRYDGRACDERSSSPNWVCTKQITRDDNVCITNAINYCIAQKNAYLIPSPSPAASPTPSPAAIPTPSPISTPYSTLTASPSPTPTPNPIIISGGNFNQSSVGLGLILIGGILFFISRGKRG